MKTILSFAALISLSTYAQASLTQYTTEADFLSAIGSDYYLENFDGLAGGTLASPTSFGPVGGYSYSATASVSDLFVNFTADGKALSTNTSEASIDIDFTGLDVTAIGGFFYPGDRFGTAVSGLISLAFSDGSTYVDLSATGSSFAGFTSTVALTSMTIGSGAPGECLSIDFCWPTLDDFYVGTAVSEPISFALFGIALTGLGLSRRKKVTEALKLNPSLPFSNTSLLPKHLR